MIRNQPKFDWDLTIVNSTTLVHKFSNLSKSAGFGIQYTKRLIEHALDTVSTYSLTQPDTVIIKGEYPAQLILWALRLGELPVDYIGKLRRIPPYGEY